MNNKTTQTVLKCLALAFILLYFSGCSMLQKVKPAYTANGKQVYEAKCNGPMRTMNDCFTRASETCGGDFDTINKAENVNMFDQMETRRALLFTCK